ncbi:MAG: HEAT repeat domain-containing protein, partial [Planctomycetota bacterium]|nr:HEAT repeat domain-containing protein [Planctomycetota bacterium]
IQQHPKEGRPALWKLVKAPSTHLRVVAGAALCRMGESKAAPVVAKALTDEGVADTARATLLMRIYSVRDAAVQAAVRGFLRVDVPYQVVQAAIYNVYLVRDKEALAPLRALDEHEQPGVRAMAGACRMLLGDPDGAATTTQAFEEGGIDTGAIYKVKTLLEQARPVPPSRLDAVHAAMDDETNAYALRTMIEILGAHGHAKASKAIRALLEHTDSNVSKAAFEALARFPGGVSPETMRTLLEGGDDGRRLAAAEALRRADDPSGFAVVVEILR